MLKCKELSIALARSDLFVSLGKDECIQPDTTQIDVPGGTFMEVYTSDQIQKTYL